MEKTHLLTILVSIIIGLSVLNLVFTMMVDTKLSGITGNAAADNNNPQAVQQPTNNGPTQRIKVSDNGDPSVGSKDAKVTIVEFSDFQCPYCGMFETNTYPQLKSQYIDTGKVRLVFRNFPLTSIHQNAEKAAEASDCANEQGKFWEYHAKLFANQQALDVTNLKQYASDLKLDTTKFNSCLDTGKMASAVQKDQTDGSSYGVSGTPTFYINGIKLVGAQPFSAFQTAIDSELKN